MFLWLIKYLHFLTFRVLLSQDAEELFMHNVQETTHNKQEDQRKW